ncbi:succinyldiaminopimelate desuccinylase [Rhizobiales bacterium GAS191]|nr:succinyldiaminopimelate desuccinylase [Rhizobiales bacterium GAS191]
MNKSALSDPENLIDRKDLTDPTGLLVELIRCPSVTPAEGGALAFLETCLKKLGFAVERPVFGEAGAQVENLYARLGEEAPCLVFAGHADVVPAGDVERWSHGPFAGEIADGFVYGRGAVDMKGGIAAMLAAAARHLGSEAHGTQEGPKGRPKERPNERPWGSIAFLITGDEEGPAINGTVKLLEWAKERGEVFDHCILGEPTNPSVIGEVIKIGRRGSLTGTLTVLGTQGHVAYPMLADNPLHRLPGFISALTQPLDRGSAHFDASSLQIVAIDTGNPASNVIPARTVMRFNIRFNDRWTPQTLEAEIERRCRSAAGNLGFELAFEPTNSVSFLAEPGGFVELVRGAIEAETGRVPSLSTSGGTSDARFIKDHCPVIEFGLVGDTMHAVDERASIADLERLTAIYQRLLADYFARGRD